MRRQVSVGTKRPLTQARAPGRPKGFAFRAVGSPGVFHVPLYNHRCLLTALTPVSTITSLQIDRSAGGLRFLLSVGVNDQATSPLNCRCARRDILAVTDAGYAYGYVAENLTWRVPKWV